MEKLKNMIKNFNWGALWSALLKILEKRLVKKAVLAIVGTTTGFTAWVVSFIVEIGWDMIGVPLANLAKRKGLLLYDWADGEIKVLKLKQAKENNDEDAYNDVIDNT